MKKLFSAVVISWVWFAFFKCSTVYAQSTVDMHIFGLGNHQSGASVYPLVSGGYIIGGYTSEAENFQTANILLIKTTSNFTPIWSKSFGDLGVDAVKEIIQDPFSEEIYAVCSSYNPVSGYDYSLWKWDVDGNLIWKKTYSNPYWDFGNCMTFSPLGNLILAGSVMDSLGNRNSFLAAFDSQGDSLWFTLCPKSGNDQINEIIYADTMIVAVGYAQDQYGNTDGRILYFNSNGNLWLDSLVGGSLNESFEDIKLASDGNFLITGSANSTSVSTGTSVYMLKCNREDATVLFERKHGFNNAKPEASSLGKEIIELVSGRLACISTTEVWGSGGKDVYLVFTNNMGGWQMGPTIGGNFNEEIFDCITDSSGHYICAGYAESYGFGGKDVMVLDFWVLDTGLVYLYQYDHSLSIQNTFTAVENNQIKSGYTFEKKKSEVCIINKTGGEAFAVYLYNALGQQIIASNTSCIALDAVYASGVYVVCVQDDKSREAFRFYHSLNGQ